MAVRSTWQNMQQLSFMARGLVIPWKLPVGYALPQGRMKYIDLYSPLLDCIKNLGDIGVNVKAVVANHD